MSRRAAQLDFSIRGDEQEHQRVLLEHNLQHTDLSLHLSSTPDEYSDVEYPRHASVPSPPFSAFASFDHRSGDDFDPHEQSRFQAWSYHTDDGAQPYAAESLSTAAHHASALTFSAGLGGGRAPRRDLSLSGAEYDPDRPLQGIMAGIAGRVRGFDANSTKSRQITASVVDFDPLIVDDTAELDRVLQSGHAPPGTIRSARSSSPSSGSDTNGPLSPPPQQDSRPRLADALSHMTFSPKRPRSAQGLPSPRLANISLRTSTPDRTALARHLPPSSSSNLPASTPRPQRRINQSLSYAQNSVSQHVEPEVNILPATPSLKQSLRERDESSKFTNMARGLAQEIEAEADAMMKRNTRPATDATPKAYHHSTVHSKPRRQRSPLREMMNEKPPKTPYAATPFKKSVQLPDVTGLTSAIASPSKVEVEFYGYDPKDTTEAEARLIATLSVVQNKLAYLEAENSVSRRRVRELELELEACKKEVVRERTRIMEHEHSIMRDEAAPGARRAASQRERIQQQKRKAEEDQAGLAAAEARYKAAVEEKKALEALITTLRSHLTRLTAELSEHKQLLLELRSLRDSDARALAEKGKEVDKLRQEVERLAGEVEVLRGVVEEGLKERRSFREQSASNDQESSAESAEETSREEGKPAPQQQEPQIHRPRAPSVHSDASEDEESEESISRRSPTPSPGRRLGVGAADRTMRTDYATIASSQGPSVSAVANVSKPFLDVGEVSRITQEVEERRSERSIQSRSQDDSQSQSGSASQEGSRSWSRNPQPNQSRMASRAGSPSMMLDDDPSGSAPQVPLAHLEHSVRFAGEPSQTESSRPPSPYTQADITQQPTVPSRPVAPTPAAASQKRRVHTAPQAQTTADTPFPQIRGARLERLFFSAPEHHAETCTMCHRRRRRRPVEVEQAAEWVQEHSRMHQYHDEESEECFAEEPDVRERERRGYPAKSARDRMDDRVPPQTVLARVLRELEDDFAHYKSIYVELADQYKDMDPVSNVVKRNVLADHLREVIDILEQKGNQIASLYDLLTFKDKPVGESVVTDKPAPRSAPSTFGPSQGRVHVRRYQTS
ncbi:hypothetical protein L226DRAFT_90071 [Lentinus tigrinus ALCF2SS1-7]|uniref:Cep57 centrosome microtubule-binding domain-containing protein n=1 Tax=Lentinus tigrinus ALCF2SS1-6 TaxID=1328759 RepID=A0A5C2RTG7_9APHY|nr:hypothetical protein L227DRAFT_595896 [Lentinus tigrinus ALCF2SS1-6]RPD73880.1 hypothetical protein L226DRAFT_90071 [Lentinus tigrinus ALCF2SS1-7]